MITGDLEVTEDVLGKSERGLILVIGATGLIGRHVVSRLLGQGANVRGWPLTPTPTPPACRTGWMLYAATYPNRARSRRRWRASRPCAWTGPMTVRPRASPPPRPRRGSWTP